MRKTAIYIEPQVSCTLDKARRAMHYYAQRKLMTIGFIRKETLLR